MSSSSIDIVGREYGGTLGRPDKWEEDGLAEGSALFSCMDWTML